MSVDVLADGETIADAKEDARIDWVDWNPNDCEANVWMTDGTYHTFLGVTRLKLEALIYAPSPDEVLKRWLA